MLSHRAGGALPLAFAIRTKIGATLPENEGAAQL
jgi:hypothetical protein